MIEIPIADSVAWTNRPLQIPRDVVAPSDHPPLPELRMTSIVSTPGVRVSIVTAIMQVINVCGSMSLVWFDSCLVD